MYKLMGHPKQAFVHDTVEPSELWHRRLAHVHYRSLPIEAKLLKVFHKSKKNMMGSAKDV